MWHSYERVFEMVAIAMGACTYYTNLRTIGEDLKTVRPTVMASAPRLWENLYQKLMDRIDQAPPIRRTLFNAARFCTCRVKRAERFFLGQELDLHGRRPIESLLRGIGHLARWIRSTFPTAFLTKSSWRSFARLSDAAHFAAPFPAAEPCNRMWTSFSISSGFRFSRVTG